MKRKPGEESVVDAATFANPDDLVYAHHPGAQSIPTDTLARAAAELDTAVAIGEVFRSDPQWAAPARVWGQLRDTLPNLLGPST